MVFSDKRKRLFRTIKYKPLKYNKIAFMLQKGENCRSNKAKTTHGNYFGLFF